MSGLQLSRLVEIADKLYPFELAEPWDNTGIQIGNPNRPIDRITFSLDPSILTLRFAARNHCHLLITHHPLLLSPVIRLVATDYPASLFLHAARLDVDVLSLHTNFDAAPGGLNDHLAEILGLVDVQTPDRARCARIGNIPNPVTLKAFARDLADLFENPSVQVISRDDRTVEHVFCASGSGMSYLPEAVATGAQVMVTGDVRYHAAIQALEAGMAVIDCGHFHLEKTAPYIMANAFGKVFKELDVGVECIVCEEEKDPFA